MSAPTVDQAHRALALVAQTLSANAKTLMISERAGGGVTVEIGYGFDPVTHAPRVMHIGSRAQLLGQLQSWGIVGPTWVSARTGETMRPALGAELWAALDAASDVLP